MRETRGVDEAVAKELGYSAWFHETPNDNQRGWKIVDSNGASVMGTAGWPTEKAAWTSFFSDSRRQWSTRLDAAWTLLSTVSVNERLLVLETLADFDVKDAAKAICDWFLE